jgi:hypothetical protein
MQTQGGLRRNTGMTQALLGCGIAAGPVFTLAWLVQGATRANYDPLRYPISSLSIGDAGWMQIATFIVTGLLTLAFGIGLWRLLRPSGAVWGPVLVGLIGIGLMGAGLFVTDPLNGYPSGTSLLPTARTTHGILHDLFGVPVFLGLPITSAVCARYFARTGQRGWVAYSALSGSAMFAVFVVARLSLRPGFDEMAGLFGLFQRIALTIGWAWLTLLAVHMWNAFVERPEAAGQRTYES